VGLVEYTVSDAVARITLNRPPVNALNAELITDIGAALGQAAAPDVRAVVITGSPHFAAGADITEFQAAFESDGKADLASDLGSVVKQLEDLEKQTIAAVNGFALGGGFELAMGADFRYLADDARVGQPEILLGIIPGAGGTQRTLGLADKVVASDELGEAAMADALRFAAGPTAAYAAVKRAIAGGLGVSLEQGLEIETAEFAGVFETGDARRGIAAFLSKGAPDFTGQ